MTHKKQIIETDELKIITCSCSEIITIVDKLTKTHYIRSPKGLIESLNTKGAFSLDEVTHCNHCNSMTHSIRLGRANFQCGKCKIPKNNHFSFKNCQVLEKKNRHPL